MKRKDSNWVGILSDQGEAATAEYLCKDIKQQWDLCFQQELDQGSTDE